MFCFSFILMPTVFRNFSALKLLDLNRHLHIFERTNARTVLDLAAAPGGFSQVALDQMMLLHYHGMRFFSGDGNYTAHCRSKRQRRVSFDVAYKDTYLCSLPPLVISVDQRPLHSLYASHSVRLQANIEDTAHLHHLVDGALSCTPRDDKSRGLSTSSLHPFLSSSFPKRPIQVVLHDGVSVTPGQHSFSVSYAQNQMVMQLLRFTCELFTRQVASGCWPCMTQCIPCSSSKSHSLSTFTDKVFDPPSKLGKNSPVVKQPCADLSSAVSFPLPVIFLSKVFQSSHFPVVLRAFRSFFRDVAVHVPLVRCENDSFHTKDKKTKRQLEAYVVGSEFRADRWQEYIKSKHLRREKPWKQCHRSPQGFYRIRKESDVLSMPPDAEDVPRGKSFFWRCVGCQQLRSGVNPCPFCAA